MRVQVLDIGVDSVKARLPTQPPAYTRGYQYIKQ